MNLLEKYGLLEKTHTSSGRIPSINGYKYYELNILKPYLSNDTALYFLSEENGIIPVTVHPQKRLLLRLDADRQP